MTDALARYVMALAAHSLGEHRRDWGLAMEAEFDAARADGKALSFALGCLAAASRQLPTHEEGRFAIASHVLALGVIVPATALMVAAVLAGFPSSYLGHAGVHDLLAMGADREPLLNEGTSFAIPSLALLVLLLTLLNLRLAWLALARDWTRLAAVGALSAAATAALAILSAVAFVDPVAPIAQATVLAIELAAAAALARWHTQLRSAAAELPAV